MGEICQCQCQNLPTQIIYQHTHGEQAGEEGGRQTWFLWDG